MSLGTDSGDGSAFIAVLTTRGRVTGREHSKTLKAVKYNGRIYFSRHRPDSDWFKNIAAGGEVSVQLGSARLHGRATIVRDEALSQRISELKYPGERRAGEKRVVVEVTLCE